MRWYTLRRRTNILLRLRDTRTVAPAYSLSHTQRRAPFCFPAPQPIAVAVVPTSPASPFPLLLFSRLLYVQLDFPWWVVFYDRATHTHTHTHTHCIASSLILLSMLNPRAYRAALLEELTSANDLPTDAVRVAATRPAPWSQVRLSREPATPQHTECGIEDDVVLRRRDRGRDSLAQSLDTYTAPHGNASSPPPQQQQQRGGSLHTVTQGYGLEKENHRSLILSFIDNCIRAGVPEEAIAEQVQFMVASMKESLALHAALHAQRHKDRIREYEVGTLTNMVERQQIQLAQQQQQQQQQEEVGYTMAGLDYGYPPSMAPLQLAPPPPLAYTAQTSPFHTGSSAESVHARSSPSQVPITVRHPSSLSHPEQRPSVQLHRASRRSPHRDGKQGSDEAGDVSCATSSSSCASSQETPAASRVKEGKSKGNADTKASTKGPFRQHAHHHHSHRSRSHRALCEVCLRIAAEGNAATAPAQTSSKRRKASLFTTPPTKRSAGSATARQQHKRNTASRQRYTANGHYMKPTHASLVRRASSSMSPLRSSATPATSNAPSRGTSPLSCGHRRAPPPPRKLVVRSTYSSRLRATSSRPQTASAEVGAGEATTSDREDSEDSRGSACRSPRADRSRSTSSSSVSSTSIRAARERKDKKVAHTHAPRREVQREDVGQGTTTACVDLYSVETPPHASLRPRVARAAQASEGRTTTTRAHVPPPPSFATTRTADRPSIDPEPPSMLLTAAAASDDEVFGETRTAHGEKQKTPAQEAGALNVHQTQQHQQHRPRRAPPPQPSVQQDEAAAPVAPPTRAVASAANAKTVLMVDSDDYDAAPPVCVTSPQLQYFLEASQRRVRETERLLASTPSQNTTTPSVTWKAEQKPLSSQRTEVPLAFQPRRSVPVSVTAAPRVAAPVTPSPATSTITTFCSDRSAAAVREKQQQRLRELRDRLRDYDTPVGDASSFVAGAGNAVRRGGETSFASAWSSSSAATPSPDAPSFFRPRYVPSAAALPQEPSPLMEISPTSSDEDSCGA